MQADPPARAKVHAWVERPSACERSVASGLSLRRKADRPGGATASGAGASWGRALGSRYRWLACARQIRPRIRCPASSGRLVTLERPPSPKERNAFSLESESCAHGVRATPRCPAPPGSFGSTESLGARGKIVDAAAPTRGTPGPNVSCCRAACRPHRAAHRPRTAARRRECKQRPRRERRKRRKKRERQP